MRTLKQALFCFGLIMAASQASAATLTTVHFDVSPPQPFNTALGNAVTQEGLTVTSSANDPAAYLSPFNSSEPDGIITGQASTFNIITKSDGSAFAFGGIGVGNYLGVSSYATILFAFNFADGSLVTHDVTFNNVNGLADVTFDPSIYTNLKSVVFGPDGAQVFATDNRLLFNDIVVSSPDVSAVPLPASLPMFGAALLALGGVSYGLNRRGNTGSGTATNTHTAA